MKQSKVVLVSVGSFGDLVPVISLAKMLKTSGLDVELISFSPFKELVERQNIPFYGVCTAAQYESMVSLKIGFTNPQYCAHHFLSCHQYAIEPIYRRLRDLDLTHRCTVMAQRSCTAALWACETANIPLIELCVCPSQAIRRFAAGRLCESDIINFESYEDSEQMIIEKSIIAGLRDRLGLLPNFGSFDSVASWSVCLYPELLLGRYLPLLRQNESWSRNSFLGFLSLPIHQSDASLSSEFRFLYTCGTAFTASVEEFDLFVNLCSEFKARGLFIAPNRDSQIKSNLHVEVRGFSDISSYLNNADVVLHHGGIGTLGLAMSNGVPQIILPRAFDQHVNGYLLETLKVGATLSLNRPDISAALAIAVKRLVKDARSTKNRCLKILLSGDDFEGLFQMLSLTPSPKE